MEKKYIIKDKTVLNYQTFVYIINKYTDKC